jgi:RimJ/RimL family protein N-acetyltransferase
MKVDHTAVLETERLRLRHFERTDAPFIIELLNSPGWLQYIGDRNVKTEDQAIQYLQNGPMKSYEVNGFGLSLVERKDDEQAIGMCGIIKREGLDHPDIGFAFLPPFEGKGYAYEIAAATLQYAKEQLGISKVTAITLPINTRSIRLLEKIGLHLTGTTRLPNSEEDLLLYSS